MDWIIQGLIGWCGTGWPRRFPGSGGGGGFDPDNPWPPNCIVCGGIIGALSSLVINQLLGAQLANVDFLGHAAVSFAAGSVGNQVVNNVVGLFRK